MGAVCGAGRPWQGLLRPQRWPGTCALLLQVTQKIQTLRVELYATRLDALRLVLEVALTLCVAVMAGSELRGMYRVGAAGHAGLRV